jgi:predicted transcriptional regulator
MTITLELPPDLEVRLRVAAEERHLSVEEIVKAYLSDFRLISGRQDTPPDQIDRGFEEAADLIPDGIPPLSDEAISREGIYTREDDWNR